MSERIRKVNALIKEELSKIILKEIEFPDGFFVTISEVETSADLRHAKIHVSIIPKNEEERALLELKENSYRLQEELNRKLKVQYVPRINFCLDTREERAGRIEEIIAAEKDKRNEQ